MKIIYGVYASYFYDYWNEKLDKVFENNQDAIEYAKKMNIHENQTHELQKNYSFTYDQKINGQLYNVKPIELN